jgi:hypothetical protein
MPVVEAVVVLVEQDPPEVQVAGVLAVVAQEQLQLPELLIPAVVAVVAVVQQVVSLVQQVDQA